MGGLEAVARAETELFGLSLGIDERGDHAPGGPLVSVSRVVAVAMLVEFTVLDPGKLK